MKHLLRTLRRRGIGEHPLGEEAFWKMVEADDIFFHASAKRFPYYYTVPKDDLRVLAVPKRLTGLKWLYAAYHEMGHHLLDGGAEPCIAFLGGSDSKCEAEADAVALLALFPSPDIRKSQYPIKCRFSQKLWDDRVRLYFLYGI